MIKPAFLGVIPARGGSKGLPGKNIRLVGGKPLIVWTIEAALSSKYLSRIVVTSDSQEILDIASNYPVETLLRPAEFATDESPTEPVIQHVLETCTDTSDKYSYVVLLQPTSIARNEEHIDRAIELFQSRLATSLISVYEPEHTPLKSFVLNESGYLKGILDNKMPFMRRQDLPVAYMPNGGIYIVGIKQFLQSHSLFTDNCVPYVMSIEDSIDIDSLNDIREFESRLKND